MNEIKYEITKTVEVDTENYAIDAIDEVETRLRDDLTNEYGDDIAEDIYDVAIVDVYKAIIKQAEEDLARAENWLKRIDTTNIKQIEEEEEED